MVHFLTAADKNSRSRKLKHAVIEAVNELIQDIDTCHEQIAEQAVEHIHQKYLLFTLPCIYLFLGCFSERYTSSDLLSVFHTGFNDLWKLYARVTKFT